MWIKVSPLTQPIVLKNRLSNEKHSFRFPKLGRGLVKKVLIPFLLGLKFKTTVLLPLAFALIALKAWKALTLGLLSLVVSAAVVVFKLSKPKVRSTFAFAWMSWWHFFSPFPSDCQLRSRPLPTQSSRTSPFGPPPGSSFGSPFSWPPSSWALGRARCATRSHRTSRRLGATRYCLLGASGPSFGPSPLEEKDFRIYLFIFEIINLRLLFIGK